MATMATHRSPPPRYTVENYTTSVHEDDNDLSFRVRRNGKAFYIDISPKRFVNSPETTEEYMSYLKVLGWDVDDKSTDIDENHVVDWALRPFEPLFVELAPIPEPGSIEVTARDFFHSEFFVLELDVVDEELRPRRVDTDRSPYMPPGVWLTLMLDEGSLSEGFPEDDSLDEAIFDVGATDAAAKRQDFLDDVRRWTRLYDPAEVILSFDNPEDALYLSPRRVLVDNGHTTCFFSRCDSPFQTLRELRAHKRMAASNLDRGLHIRRLHGVVWDGDHNSILGLLVSYIDNGHRCDTSLFCRMRDEPPTSLRERWAAQLNVAVTALHSAGAVWGDVEPFNVLIDRDDNAWITNFGGGYTEGWVDADMAGTVEGDLGGMAKIREFIFHPVFETGIFVLRKHIS